MHRRIRPFTTSEAQMTAIPLIEPTLENLTVGLLPTDQNQVVICGPNGPGLTDKLVNLYNQHKSQFVKVPSTGQCANSITARMPRSFIQSLLTTLDANNNGCYQQTQTFMQLLTFYLSSTTDDFINIQRNFWGALSAVFNELNISESTINKNASILRALSMAASNDTQSLPSNRMLEATLTTIDNLDANNIDPIDNQFRLDFPNLILPQPDPSEVLSSVVNNSPSSVGETSTIPATNEVETGATSNGDNIQLHDLDDMDTLQGQAYAGLKDLYSAKTLMVPIQDLRIVNGNMVSFVEQTTIPIVTGVRLVNSALEVDTVTKTIMELIKVDVSNVDLTKSLADSDWIVEQLLSPLSTTPRQFYDVTSLLNNEIINSAIEPFSTTTQFRGTNTNKLYTLVEAQGLGTSLSALWSKVRNSKLLTPEHIMTGTTILASGLGVAGKLFGSAGLVKSSDIIMSLTDGLGKLLPTLQTVGGITPEPVAAMRRSALGIIPCTSDAGKSSYEAISVNSQNLRINLNNNRRIVEAAFSQPSSQQNGVALKRYQGRDSIMFY